MRSLGDLATSFVPPLHSFACPCNPHVLTYAMFTSPCLHKLCNAHLPEVIQPVSVYMLDEDLVALFLSLFGNHNKEELLADTKLMESYFGSVEAAHD